jgi:hypothetical protein
MIPAVRANPHLPPGVYRIRIARPNGGGLYLWKPASDRPGGGNGQGSRPGAKACSISARCPVKEKGPRPEDSAYQIVATDRVF